jgi:hypothetical protein
MTVFSGFFVVTPINSDIRAFSAFILSAKAGDASIGSAQSFMIRLNARSCVVDTSPGYGYPGTGFVIFIRMMVNPSAS